MKVFKVLAMIAVVLIFIAGLTLIAMAADRTIPNVGRQGGPLNETMPQPQYIPAHACPAGWHVGNSWWHEDSGSKIAFYFCCPNEIQRYSCPNPNYTPASRVDKYGCRVYVCGPMQTNIYPPEYQ